MAASPNNNFRLPEDDRERWQKAASREERTLSSLVKVAVERYLAAEHPDLARKTS